MNLAIRRVDFNPGKEPADTFLRNQHPSLRADFVLANPPFSSISPTGGVTRAGSMAPRRKATPTLQLQGCTTSNPQAAPGSCWPTA